MEYTICHVCGGSVTQPEAGLFKCDNCGNVLDVRAFTVNEKDEDQDQGEFDEK